MHRSELTSWQKALALVVWVASITTFTSIGWDVIRPYDPLAPVSLLALAGPVMVLVQVAALVAVTSALATVIVGRYLTDAGVFASAVGLAALAMRGSTSEQLLLAYTTDQSLARISLVAGQLFEVVAWTIVMATSVAVSTATARWFSPGRSTPAGDGAPPGVTTVASARLSLMAGSQIPRFGPALAGDAAEPASGDLRANLRHTGFVAAVMLAALAILSIDSQQRAIRHGQVTFVVCAAAWLGTYFGFRHFPVRSALWSLLAVPIVALACCLWSAVVPVPLMLPVTLPPSVLMRPLPIQFVAVGCAGVMWAYWFVHHPASNVLPQDRGGVQPSRAARAT